MSLAGRRRVRAASKQPARAAKARGAVRQARAAASQARSVAGQARRARQPAARRVQPPLEYRILLTATMCLLAAGAVMVYSASSTRDVLQHGGSGSGYLAKYVGYGLIGLLLMQILQRQGLDVVRRATPLLLVASLFMVLLVLTPFGVEANGARRWLGAGQLQFQPSELLKVALVLYGVALLAKQPKRVRSLKGIVSPLLLVAGFGAVLVAMQPDLGTALVIIFSIGSLLIVAGVPGHQLAKIAAAGVVVIGLYALLEPYRRARLTSFIDPWAHAGGSGFQAVQGQIAVGSGGLFGVGLGQSTQKAFYLPEAHTDFILAVIGEELGIVGIFGVLSLYAMIAYAGLRTAKAAVGSYAKLLAAGLTAMIISQAALNVFAVLGLAPLTGVPLPFISYGSTNLIVMLGAMGLLLNVASGRSVRLRAVETPAPRRTDADASRDRGGRDRRARGARTGGRRRAAG